MDEQHIDCVFPLISGYGGEDGTLQGLLELSNIPYVGADVAASANAMDKALTRLFAAAAGLKQPRCLILKKDEFLTHEIEFEQKVDFGYPVYVKPVSLGSSVGISRVAHPSQLREAINKAFKYESKIMIEEGIEGKEIKVAVLGNDDPITGDICEITVPKGAVNDYETKHIKFTSTKRIPADITEDTADKVKHEAIAIYKELECEGMARVDFFLNNDGEVFFNEINTVPGIGKHSIYSQMFESAGLPIKDMLTELIDTAFKNKQQVSETSNDTFKEIF